MKGVLLLCLVLISSLEAFDILVYSPRMFPSHVTFVAKIANLLAGRGHRVTVVDSVFRYDIPNSLDLSKISKIIEVEPSPNLTAILKSDMLVKEIWTRGSSYWDKRNRTTFLADLHATQCAYLLKDPNVIPLLNMTNFDFAIFEVFDACGLALVEVLKLKKFSIVSTTLLPDFLTWSLGFTKDFDVPSYFSDLGGFKVSYIERLFNVLFYTTGVNLIERQENILYPIFKNDFKIVTNFHTTAKKVNLVFVNDNTANFHREVVHQIAGIAFKDPEPLSKEYQEILETSKPIVLISFGTAAKATNMPMLMKESFVNVIASMSDVMFIWKYEEEVEADFSNLVYRRYVPQSDLLRSGRISLFITHGGQNSLLETFHTGTKALVIPIFGDQNRNARKAWQEGLVKTLDKELSKNPWILEETIRNAMKRDAPMEKRLRNMKKYMKNTKKRAENRFLDLIWTTYSKQNLPSFVESRNEMHPLCYMICVIFMSFIVSYSSYSLTNRFMKKIRSFLRPT